MKSLLLAYVEISCSNGLVLSQLDGTTSTQIASESNPTPKREMGTFGEMSLIPHLPGALRITPSLIFL